MGLAGPGEHVVRRLAHQREQLGRVADEDRLGAHVGLGVARAVPVEVVPAGTPAAAVVLPDADLELLNEKNVDVEFKTPQSSFLGSLIPLLLPVGLIIGFFVWMQRRAAGQMGNVMSIGRSRAKTYSADKPSTTFADVAGYEGVKQEIREVVASNLCRCTGYQTIVEAIDDCAIQRRNNA